MEDILLVPDMERAYSKVDTKMIVQVLQGGGWVAPYPILLGMLVPENLAGAKLTLTA